jgi:hypothetical protein
LKLFVAHVDIIEIDENSFLIWIWLIFEHCFFLDEFNEAFGGGMGMNCQFEDIFVFRFVCVDLFE